MSIVLLMSVFLCVALALLRRDHDYDHDYDYKEERHDSRFW